VFAQRRLERLLPNVDISVDCSVQAGNDLKKEIEVVWMGGEDERKIQVKPVR
jgi:hypothetical protein